MKRAPVLVVGIGNPSRGDDAVGPLLAARLDALVARIGAHDAVEVLCDQQLMVEHALDVEDRSAVIFIDAAVGTAGQVQCEPVVPAVGLPVLSHRCSPGQLLGLVASTLQRPSPPAWTVSVAGHGFELGAPLHPTTAQAVETAWSMLLAQLNRCGVTLPDITTTPPIGSANA
jgi:hydrogenase maturation protease